MAYIAVKVYQADNEIRRFILEREEDNRFSYQRLLQKVQQVYPDLDANRQKLMWKDLDGELIRMSTSPELMEAIRSLPLDNQILRVYLIDAEKPVQEQQAQLEQQEMQTDQQESIDPNLHGQVVCDGCQGAVSGIRYKCLTCPDYDLCSICIEKSIHDEHPTIRITSPTDQSWKAAFIASQSPFLAGFGRRFGPGGRWGGGRGRHCHGRGSCKRQNEEEMKETEPQTASAAAGEENKTKEQEQTGLFNEEFTRNLGETISTFLNAFGIPVNNASGTPTPQENATASNVTNETVSAPAGGHPDPRIEAALNYMLAMGYTNDGGWLTKLLEEKRGDVSAVLDIMHPTQNQ